MSVPIDRINTVDTLANTLESNLKFFPEKIHFNIRGKLIVIDRVELPILPTTVLALLFPNGFHLLLKHEGGDVSSCFKCHKIDPSICKWILDTYLLLFKKSNNAYPSKIAFNPISNTTLVLFLTECCNIYLFSENKKPVDQKIRSDLLEQTFKNNDVFESADKKKIRKGLSDGPLVDALQHCGFRYNDKWAKRVKEPKLMSLMSYIITTVESSSLSEEFLSKILKLWGQPGNKCWWINEVIKVNGSLINVWRRKQWLLEVTIMGNRENSQD